MRPPNKTCIQRLAPGPVTLRPRPRKSYPARMKTGSIAVCATKVSLFVALFVGGCGGAQTKPSSANGNSGTDAEKDCLAAAAAHAGPKKDAPSRITVAHILVRHAELAHPEGATRTRGQACLRALQALNKLKDGAEWADVVKEYSDAPGPNAGSLGSVTKDDLDPSFAAVAFSLDVNEISYVLESYRGFHVVIRKD